MFENMVGACGNWGMTIRATKSGCGAPTIGRKCGLGATSCIPGPQWKSWELLWEDRHIAIAHRITEAWANLWEFAQGLGTSPRLPLQRSSGTAGGTLGQGLRLRMVVGGPRRAEPPDRHDPRQHVVRPLPKGLRLPVDRCVPCCFPRHAYHAGATGASSEAPTACPLDGRKPVMCMKHSRKLSGILFSFAGLVEHRRVNVRPVCFKYDRASHASAFVVQPEDLVGPQECVASHTCLLACARPRECRR